MHKPRQQTIELFKDINTVLQMTHKTHDARFNFIDLFAGIGGFRIALQKLGGHCMGYSEIDKQAIKVYKQNFITSSETELGDITKISLLPPTVDIIVGGVPCQPWSVAGRLRGFEDPRGKLWFDVIRLVNKNQPKGFIFENVSGLASPKNRENLDLILGELTKAGYCVKWKVLNTHDYGLPQNRNRVFIVGIRQNIERCQEYKFPEPLNIQSRISDVFDELKNVDVLEKLDTSNKLKDFFIFSDIRNGHTTIHSWDIISTSNREKSICLALLKSRRSKKYGDKDGNPLSFYNFKEIVANIDVSELNELVKKEILRLTLDHKYDFVNSKSMTGINNVYRIILPIADIFPTLTATGGKDYVATEFIYGDNSEQYRKLFLEKIYKPHKYIPITAKHARKLQGFPPDFEYHKNDEVAKKQFGNAVPVPVVECVAQELLRLIRRDIIPTNTTILY
jgi:DNA (cytosine-5)-methyltransferase 1